MWARERGMSVRDLQAATDSDEFAEWRAYQELNPATEERADFRAAIVAAVIANLFRGKGDQMISPVAFMPYTDKPQRAQPTTRQIEDRIAAWARGQMARQTKMRAIRGQA